VLGAIDTPHATFANALLDDVALVEHGADKRISCELCELRPV
jgi:hypothetical protein